MSSIKTHKNYVDLLSAEEEKELFIKWKETGKDRYINIIIEKHAPLIHKAVRELAGYGLDPDELMSEGYVGIVHAANNFNPEMNLRFSTYARKCIKGVMLAYVVKNFSMINPCTSHEKKTLFFGLRRLIANKIKEEGSFEMTDLLAEEIAINCGTTAKNVKEMNNMFMNPIESLNAAVSSDAEHQLTREDTLFDEFDTPYQNVEFSNTNEFHKRLVEQAMTISLDKRERRIFEAQVLHDKEDTLTLHDLSIELGISRERVRQIRNSATDKVSYTIKKLMASENLHSGDLFSEAA